MEVERVELWGWMIFVSAVSPCEGADVSARGDSVRILKDVQ